MITNKQCAWPFRDHFSNSSLSSNPVQCRPVILVPCLCTAIHLQYRNRSSSPDVTLLDRLDCNALLLSRVFQVRVAVILETISLPRPVHCEADIRTGKRQTKEHKLDQEPCPAASAAATLLLPCHGRSGLATLARSRGRGRAAGVLLVQVERLDGDDVVVIGEFTGFGAEA